MKLPAIVQVRNNTPHLRNVALEPILGYPVIEHLLNRIRAMTAISHIVVATSTDASDDGIAAYCQSHAVDCFRGSQQNVLERIFFCAQRYHMDQFVKFLGNSPIIDIYLCDEVITRFFTIYSDVDYLSNIHPSSYPPGMHIEIIRTGALRIAQEAPDLSKSDCEMVTSYLWNHPEQFKIINIEAETDLPATYRFIIEYPEDLLLVRKLIEAMTPLNPLFSLTDAIDYLNAHPHVKMLNANRYA